MDLKDQYGKNVQLRGMSSHGLLWFPQYTNYAALKTTKDYGANVFRIAAYSDQEKGYINYPDEVKLFLYMTIENVIAADMYAIVDWHVLRDENPNVHIDKAIEFFDDVSKKYAGNPALIYEICNEPNGDTTWDDVKTYAEKVIPVIRKNSPDSVILVGTPNFCTNLKSVYEKQLNFDNIMYTYHRYAGKNGDHYYTKAIGDALDRGMPVFVSEWGFGNTDESVLSEQQLFLDFLKNKNISWVNWSLSNKDEVSAAIQNSSTKLSGWSLEDMSASGKFVFKALKG